MFLLIPESSQKCYFQSIVHCLFHIIGKSRFSIFPQKSFTASTVGQKKLKNDFCDENVCSGDWKSLRNENFAFTFSLPPFFAAADSFTRSQRLVSGPLKWQCFEIINNVSLWKLCKHSCWQQQYLLLLKLVVVYCNIWYAGL